MGSKPSTKQEILEFYYNNDLAFTGSEQERYNYFDEVVDKSDKVKEVGRELQEVQSRLVLKSIM
jgi:hypothetical protein